MAGTSGNEEVKLSGKLSQAVAKNRKGFLIGFIFVLVFLAGLIVFISVRDNLREKALSRVAELSRTYDSVRYLLDFEGAVEITDAPDREDVTKLLEDLAEFQSENSGFAAAWAYSLSANIHQGMKDWPLAEEAWLQAAKAAGESYLVPVSLFNAAVAAEEQDKTDAALDLYTQALAYEENFPSASRAQFAIGRLYESKSDTAAALDAYNNLVSKWPDDPQWANLAQSRIMVLSDS